MIPFTLVTTYTNNPFFKQTLKFLARSGFIKETIVVSNQPVTNDFAPYRLITNSSIFSQDTWNYILDTIQTPFIMLMEKPKRIEILPENFEKIIDTMLSLNAGLVYSDFVIEDGGAKFLYPLNDYQSGSVREDFDFGPLFFFSTIAAQKSLKKHGILNDIRHAGIYNLRLKLSIDYAIYHIREALYTVFEPFNPPSSEKHFAYLNPNNSEIQKEMEIVFTDYLKKIGAYLQPHRLKIAAPELHLFPVVASIIIPVKNRQHTIADAVKSALKQETEFSFNVIVVDNHSTDATTAILSNMAQEYSKVIHIIPERTDLGIGGCWNEAINHQLCGAYAIQLDSDDLYSSNKTLQKIISHLLEGSYAMVIGAYTLVDENLNEIPPGLIDHHEWTDENGHNNALRVNGLGAPRAFNTSVMRKIGFLNVSYGEDYAAGLRICREYRIGRIYESLYLCRRWSGNTDASLTIHEINKNNAFKDLIRTEEIHARQEINLCGLQ